MYWTLSDQRRVVQGSEPFDDEVFKISFNPKVFREWTDPGKVARDGLLNAKLEIALKDFGFDYFANALSFVSEKMRHAMALGPSDIQYFDVDSSKCAPLARSKNYRTMHVPVTEDVSDLKNSDYFCRHHPDGSLEIMSPIIPAFREDAQPVHEIFADRLFKTVYCTDDFALRVLRAGCSGVYFMHPSRDYTQPIRRFRTLRGIEEIIGWDSARKIPRTNLIQEIPLGADSAVSRGER
jgi:hypothetical protein